ncbi:hypothetical protein Lfu02_51290 [Longispora fulva]|uniref:Secreted protein n=1 Tax=Longispora fulva TaxID=619741 RepID=A0A8J7KP58_9ACTN|nr:hypothetical protein [Longispora fulva]MBG6140976.1 hypothetical protein [Longispora fulva]GIG60757.1 hypothetical protein Lfu02_51290 [Longispora fulva]
MRRFLVPTLVIAATLLGGVTPAFAAGPPTPPPSDPGSWSYVHSYPTGGACGDAGRRYVDFGEGTDYLCVGYAGGWALWLNGG